MYRPIYRLARGKDGSFSALAVLRFGFIYMEIVVCLVSYCQLVLVLVRASLLVSSVSIECDTAARRRGSFTSPFAAVLLS